MANAGAALRVEGTHGGAVALEADMNSFRGGGRYMLHREVKYYTIGIIMNLVG